MRYFQFTENRNNNWDLQVAETVCLRKHSRTIWPYKDLPGREFAVHPLGKVLLPLLKLDMGHYVHDSLNRLRIVTFCKKLWGSEIICLRFIHAKENYIKLFSNVNIIIINKIRSISKDFNFSLFRAQIQNPVFKNTPSHPERPTTSSWTFHLITVCNSALLHTARPLTPTSSCTSHHVILNLFQDLFFANLDSGSSPDDGDKRAQIPGQARMT